MNESKQELLELEKTYKFLIDHFEKNKDLFTDPQTKKLDPEFERIKFKFETSLNLVQQKLKLFC